MCVRIYRKTGISGERERERERGRREVGNRSLGDGYSGYRAVAPPLSDALHNLQFGNGRCFNHGKPQFNYYSPLVDGLI